MSEIAARWVTVYPRIASGFSTEINAAVNKGATQGVTSGGKVLGDGLGKSIKTSVPAAVGDGLEKGVTQAAPRMGSAFKSIIGPVLTGAALVKVVDFVGRAKDAFSDLEDATGAAGVVFGDSMDKIIAKSETAATTLGMSKAQIIDAANTFGTLGKSANLTGDDLADFSNKMTDVAGSLSSFKGGSPEEAVLAVGAALRGESEPIRRYGILLDDATLRQRALTLGIIDNVKSALTPQQRVLAAQAEILAQSGDAMGDFTRTADSTANVQKTLAAETANLTAEIGEKMAPAIVSAQKAGINFLTWVTDNQAAIVPLVATIGSLTLAVGGFVAVSKGIDALKAARATLVGLGDAFQSMGTKAKIATVSAGAIGVALTAAAVVYGAFAQKNADAQQAVEDFTQALKEDNGVLGENVRLQAVKSLTDAGALAAAKALGLGVDTVTDAALGNADALRIVNARLAESDSHWTSAASATTDEAKATGTLRTALGETEGAISKSRAALETQNAAMRTGVTATTAVAAATSNAAITFDEYKSKIDGTYNALLKLRGDERAVEAAIDSASESVKKYETELVKKYEKQGKSKSVAEEMAEADIKAGKALDINTEAGRNNQAALDNIASSWLSAYAAMSDADKQSEKTTREQDRVRAAFIKTAEKMGLSSKAAEKLADKLGLIKSKKITVEAEVKQTGISSITISPSAKGGLRWTVKAVAQGGAIYGPGTGTSDSIPALLSNGEHVLSADDVKDLGGQQGVYRMRALAQQGVLRFATGGPVMPTYNGHSLEWWQDYLLSDLDYTRLQIQIRDLQASLKEKETYNPPGKKKKATRLKLRGLDRTEAQQELAEAQEKLKLAQGAAKANSSAAGTIAQQVAQYDAATQAWQEAQDAAKKASDDAAASWLQAASSLGKGSGIQVGSTYQKLIDASGNAWYQTAQFSAADLVKQKNAEGDKVLQFVAKVDKLRQMGAPKGLTDDILALGYASGMRVVDAFLADPSQISGAISAYSKLDAAQSQLTSIGTAVGAAAGATIYVTANNPVAEPASVTVNKSLQYLAAVGS